MSDDEELWTQVEHEMQEKVPEAVREFVRKEGGVSQWLKASTVHDRKRRLHEVIERTYSLIFLVREVAPQGLPAANWDEYEAEESEQLRLPPELPLDVGGENYLGVGLVGRRVRQVVEYQVAEAPERWRDLSREVLSRYSDQQREVLYRVGRISGLKRSTILGRPPDDLVPEDFLLPEELEACLVGLEADARKEGEKDWLCYLVPGEGRRKRFLEFHTGVQAGQMTWSAAERNPLYDVKVCVDTMVGETGLREEDAVAFLFCNSDVCLPWLDLAIVLDNRVRGARLTLRIGTPHVPVAEVEKLYRSAREYALSEMHARSNYALRGPAFERDFTEFLSQPRAPRQTQAEARALLISFVEELRQEGESWRSIWESWNHFFPYESFVSVASLRSAYYRARTRT